ncbi:MAG TPA: type II toxin-antitoxin system VapC family toxin [Lichenihabitans sp.]|jgi:predicted nucleic acid-binding protein|nr:type II toxin-antitoxin system VapC family toxin [Lichenihabitans sp.]
MDLVVDASIAISWILLDEHNVEAEAILDRLDAVTGRVPALFWHEMQNVLLKAERRGRCRPGEADAFMRKPRRVRLAVASNRSDDAIIGLARAHQFTAYDAAYLDLAVSLSLPLTTADKRLAEAVQREGVPLLGPLAR